jgi:hypothetical protein
MEAISITSISDTVYMSINVLTAPSIGGIVVAPDVNGVSERSDGGRDRGAGEADARGFDRRRW